MDETHLDNKYNSCIFLFINVLLYISLNNLKLRTEMHQKSTMTESRFRFKVCYFPSAGFPQLSFFFFLNPNTESDNKMKCSFYGNQLLK